MIIGLSGQAHAGKDTVADFLVEHHGFVKIALADPIKRAAMEWWDFTEEQLWGDLKEEPDQRYPAEWRRAAEGSGAHDFQGFLTPRHALQQIGTEVARRIDPDVWVRITMRIADQLLTPIKVEGTDAWRNYHRTKGITNFYDLGPVKGVAISDCRFENEFKAVKENGTLVRIKRPKAGLEGEQAQHQSEAEQREFPDEYFDHIIDNDGDTLHNLKLRVDSMMDFITGKMKKYDANGDDDIPPFKRA
jgi:hypothetical protein